MVQRRAVKAAVTRRTVRTEAESNISASVPKSVYFAAGDQKDLEFFSTGCQVLDEVMGGGYVLGRVANFVGDKSSGKTLLAIEATANFHRTYPDGFIRYAEAEAAFDKQYAAALGMPVSAVEFVEQAHTVEDIFEDIERIINERNGKPGLYIIDSLDALSDRAENERKIDEGSYNMTKQKKMGEMFRRLVREIEKSRMTVIIISQMRDKIGVTFGETKTRSGGKALDFYASQVVWLAEIEKMKKTSGKVERIIGVRVKANCKKNKVGLPFRTCEFPIIFGYGIDDLVACTEFLMDVGREDAITELGLSKAGYKIRLGNLRDKGGTEVRDMREKLGALVRETWREIEMRFLPTSSKY